ncbi:hypothetical protein PHISCL_03580 [Aspergillus sclerotialis]|uniref:PH domain-containing protein n=1 Tax=Aspergillus sclerotialis TaxID=2070753 RepID=A0A3A3A414_9EURO|nr:hypothetical protein PHISCL_03580 [Aspergillus sclerotialis]
MAAADDPFVSSPEGGTVRESHRYSSFDTQLFSLDASSPAQAKRALEAHLAETERRLEEASKLGTALIDQQRELSDKLKEVERQQDDSEIGPELRQKLVELEKEYNEIGRETTRAFLAPKRLAGVADDAVPGTPSLEPKTPLSPALFASQATNSPSKVSVPSRKQRNQPSNRVHDIEFATEISTSLLAQVRQLQALLAEREDALKSVNLEKSRLELEAEGYSQRIRALDESEQRYKDENWALETQTHELMAAVKEAAERENRLNSSLSAIATEKSTVERESEDLKQINSKLLEDQAASQKANDAEIHLLRRNLTAGDAEKAALQQKLEELTSQNQELAKAVAMRLRQHETEATREIPLDTESDPHDQTTPENSPPPSPNKFTPRHNHLETETLRSSLGHAHRMIQNLKSTIHREKTEKIELKRMLQDARDEVEQRRREASGATGASNKRQKIKPDAFKKPPRPELLGAGRNRRTEVELHEADWEDNAWDASPTRPGTAKPRNRTAHSSDERSEGYQTATENDDGFETANERGTATESDAFQTGIESMADDSSDSDELTETEDSAQRTPRGPMSLSIAKVRDRNSFHSTASTSTSEDEDEDDGAFMSPAQAQAARYRLRSRRSVLRKIRPSGEAPMASGSRPSSARNSPAASFPRDSPGPEGQSLFAELAELNDGEGEGDFGPYMRSESPQASTPRMLPVSDSRRPSEAMLDSFSKPIMVDFGVMTDPWEPTPRVNGIMTEDTTLKATTSDAETATESRDSPGMVSSATQWAPFESDSNGEHLTNAVVSQKAVGDTADEACREPVGIPQLDFSSISAQETMPVAAKVPELSMSYLVGGTTEPIRTPTPESPDLVLSSIYTQYTAPMLAKLSEPDVPHLAVSSVHSQQTEPVNPTVREPAHVVSTDENLTSLEAPEMAMSAISSEHTVPVKAELLQPEPQAVALNDRAIEEPEVPELAISSINSECTEPLTPKTSRPSPELLFSTIHSVETQPAMSMSDAIAAGARQSTQETVKASRVSMRDRGTATPTFVVAEDSPSEKSVIDVADQKDLPLNSISDNAATRHVRTQSQSNQADQSAQTILSSKQIDQILTDRISSRPLSPPDSDKAKELGAPPFATPRIKSRSMHQSSTTSLPSVHRRPGSAASQVSNATSHPPLPADHREAIMAAEKKSMEQTIPSPTRMGPPLAPASAYRTNVAPRPRTPNEHAAGPGFIKTAPRPQVRRESQASRRSSVSSFASELEERFNIYPNGGPMPHGYSAGTDPRMIQAITQTMIGEFLWKYTRKTVTGDMSSTRHRRYFWVHPYTRTLYWSEHAPQSAGKAELKTKSVPIEAVRVVADDNPYPPGLHCRSLEVVSPGRRVRFTATTSQRHETWFNALSYLLLRNPSDSNEDQENNITLEDIDEFNPGFRSHSRQTARMSISSFNSRTARNAPKQRAASAMSVRTAATAGRASPALSGRSQASALQVPDETRQTSASRLSSILSTTIRGSFAHRNGRYSHSLHGDHDEGGRDRDSAEDLRQMTERQESEVDRLENVRACCDGKFQSILAETW